MNLGAVLETCCGCFQQKRPGWFFRRKVIACGIVLVILFADVGEANFLKCHKDSMCSNMNPNYCCVAINQSMGMCKMKRGIGQQCFPEIKHQLLSGGGTAFNDCGCAPGLTCTEVGNRKQGHRRKKKKKRYKHRCMPVPTEAPEVYESHHDKDSSNLVLELQAQRDLLE